MKLNKEILFEYWKKGWKVWLMQLCCTLAVVIIVFPIMILLAAVFALLPKNLLDVVAIENTVPIILGVIFGPPVLYYVFTLFYGKQ